MKKLFLYLFASLALFASCGGDDNISPPIDEPETAPKAQKTVIMYYPWTGHNTINPVTGKPTNSGLYDYFKNNIANVEVSIKKLGSAQNTRTFVIIADSPSSVDLFEIKYKNGKCTRDTLYHYTGVATNAENLKEYIAKIKQKSPSPTYAMVMGAHGNGWIPKNKTRRRTRSIGGLYAYDQFDISEIAKAITDNGIKLQYFCFDDCYMANVEVAYEMKEATRYIIASTAEIMGTGIPYEDVYQYMASQNPDYNAIVNAYLSFYKSYVYPYGSLSVIDCDYIDEMARIMKQFNAYNDAPTEAELSPQDGYQEARYYDFADYLRKYNRHITEQGSDSIAYADVLSKLVPNKVKTDELFTVYRGSEGETYTVSAYSGVTISDPSTHKDVIQNKLNTPWWAATHN